MLTTLSTLREFLYESEVWNLAVVCVWYAWLGTFALVEAYAVLDGQTATPPLTHVIVRQVPGWLTIPFLGWLFVHFTSRYLGYELW